MGRARRPASTLFIHLFMYSFIHLILIFFIFVVGVQGWAEQEGLLQFCIALRAWPTQISKNSKTTHTITQLKKKNKSNRNLKPQLCTACGPLFYHKTPHAITQLQKDKSNGNLKPQLCAACGPLFYHKTPHTITQLQKKPNQIEI